MKNKTVILFIIFLLVLNGCGKEKIELCENIDKDSNSAAYNRCYIDNSVRFGDVAVCKNIKNNDMEDFCKVEFYVEKASRLEAPDICKKIKDKYNENKCIAKVAYGVDDVNICKNSKDFQQCKQIYDSLVTKKATDKKYAVTEFDDSTVVVEELERQTIENFFSNTDKNNYEKSDSIKNVIGFSVFNGDNNRYLVRGYLSSKEKSFTTIGYEKEVDRLDAFMTEFDYFVIPEVEPGEYLINVEILENGILIYSNSKSIQITGTDKAIDASLNVCGNPDCNVFKSEFLMNTEGYIVINSDVKDIDVVAKYKNSNSQNWLFLNVINNKAKLNTNQIGNYDVVIEIEKEGYKKVFLNSNYQVINEKIQIKSESICHPNGKCEGEENSKNCPLDCI